MERDELGYLRQGVEQTCPRECFSLQRLEEGGTTLTRLSTSKTQTFLLRHVYSSTLETGKVSRKSASFLTFLLSALCHELVMCVVSKKIRYVPRSSTSTRFDLSPRLLISFVFRFAFSPDHTSSSSRFALHLPPSYLPSSLDL